MSRMAQDGPPNTNLWRIFSCQYFTITCGHNAFVFYPSNLAFYHSQGLVDYVTSLLVGMTEVLPDRCTVLAKRELLFFGPFGLAAWLSGIVFVDRLNREKACNTMDMIAKLMHDKKVSKSVNSLFIPINTLTASCFWG